MTPSLPHQQMVGRVVQALEKCATSVDPVTPARWRCTLANGVEIGVGAHVSDGWLLLDAPLDVSKFAPADAFDTDLHLRAADLLQWNAALTGGVKCALPSVLPRPRLRAELPLDDDVDVARRVRQACAGFKAAARTWLHHDAASESLNAADGTAVDLHGVCAETLWPFVQRDATTAAVDLEVPGGFRQALVEAAPTGGIVASVELAACAADAPAACRAAWSLLLLRACESVRMARAAVHGGAAGPLAARFEVVFADAPVPAELAHAFAALSLACRLVDREAGVLARDVTVASAYLQQWNAYVAEHSTPPTAAS